MKSTFNMRDLAFRHMVVVLFLAAAMLAGLNYNRIPIPNIMLWFGAAFMVTTVVIIIITTFAHEHVMRHMEKLYAQSTTEQRDPWELQRELMTISGQSRPSAPVITKGSLLYAALIMEKSAETFTALVAAISRRHNEDTTPYMDRSAAYKKERSAVVMIQTHLRQIAVQADTASLQIRHYLRDVSPHLLMPLSDKEAIELLDGTTDITVVNCGFAISTGLPGFEAYTDVVRSNLSKANPETGKIDKDGGGKWIKGSEFVKPDLRAVLHAAHVVKHR